MTITRVNELQAREGCSDELRKYLESILPEIESSEGCLYAHLLQGHDDPGRILIIETWESIAAHQLAIQDIDRTIFVETMKRLVAEARAEYFHPGDLT